MGQSKSQTLVDARVHVLYAGVTQSGKTTLARHHARILADAEYDVAVYDPVGTATAGGGWPEKARMFDSAEQLLRWIEKHRADPERPAFVFIDESADILGHGETHAHWMPRRVRHQNIYLRLIAQRPKMLPPSVRTQCAHAYVFRLASDDMRLLLSDFGHDLGDIDAKELDSGDYLVLISGTSSIAQGNCFDDTD